MAARVSCPSRITPLLERNSSTVQPSISSAGIEDLCTFLYMIRAVAIANSSRSSIVALGTNCAVQSGFGGCWRISSCLAWLSGFKLSPSRPYAMPFHFITMLRGVAGTLKRSTRLPSTSNGIISRKINPSVVCCDISCFNLLSATSPSLKEVPTISCFLSHTPNTIQPNSRSRKLASLLRAEKYLPNSSTSKLVSAFLNSTTSFSACSHRRVNISKFSSIR